jgi:hypothetical protein
MNFVPYAGNVDLDDIHTVLVARHIEFTKAAKLGFRALRALTPVHDQLFRFEREKVLMQLWIWAFLLPTWGDVTTHSTTTAV